MIGQITLNKALEGHMVVFAIVSIIRVRCEEIEETGRKWLLLLVEFDLSGGYGSSRVGARCLGEGSSHLGCNLGTLWKGTKKEYYAVQPQ